MTILVTGGAGFIGCNNIIELNKCGENDIIVVDNLKNSNKFANLTHCNISDYFDKNDFIKLVLTNKAPKPDFIFHQGACSDTTEKDGAYLMNNNYRYTLSLFHWAQELKIPFIYASSAATYGSHTEFIEDRKYEEPLNLYGYSKFLFDQVLRKEMQKGLTAPVIGLRYFNVYGPHEEHKGRMASVAFHQFFQYKNSKKVQLFKGCMGYDNGEQKRDFIYIKDVIKVLMYFFEHPISGIYNCGTGQAQTFNDVALSIVNTLMAPHHTISLNEAIDSKQIEYIPFPDDLIGKYQSFTEANLDNLRKAGCQIEFRSVEEGVSDYMKYLKDKFK